MLEARKKKKPGIAWGSPIRALQHSYHPRLFDIMSLEKGTLLAAMKNEVDAEPVEETGEQK
jgi:hypothetical protein